MSSWNEPSPPPDPLTPPPEAAEISPIRLPIENPPWTFWDVLRLLVITIVSIGIFGAVAIGIALRSLGQKDPSELARDPRLAVPAQFAAYVVLVLAMVILVRMRGAAFWRAVKWNFPFRTWAGYVALGIALAVAIQSVSALLPIPKQLPIDKYVRTELGAYMMAFFGIAVAPFVEEMFFRGFLYPVLVRRLGVFLGVVLTAIAFAFIHESQLAHAWAPLLMLFVVGVALTAVRARIQSVAGSWLVHVGYNSTLFLLLFLASDHFRHLEKLS